jgi:hypothetical protein
MPVEMLQGMDDDGLAVELQKLLGPSGGTHPLAGAAGKNQGSVHIFSPS